LCAIIGKTALNLGKDENPLDYVLGYAVGNDVTSRYWQAAERSSAQAGYSKSFDKFCPLGPVIASSKAVVDATNLRLTTKVNGEVRQDARTDDLLFSVATIIRFLSRGHTLRPGTVIMTGTPSGVGAARSPQVWLKNGDVVEIEIEKIGVIRNKFVIPEDPSFPSI
jgi:2-keto-4-pentenoate hydratase/2-oxohepta-3-ene-1,7-dioic acid hydratase in catechol pathway